MSSLKSVTFAWLEELLAKAEIDPMDDLDDVQEGEEVVGEASEFIRKLQGVIKLMREDGLRHDITKAELELNSQRLDFINELRWAELRAQFGRKVINRGMGVRKGGAVVKMGEITSKSLAGMIYRLMC